MRLALAFAAGVVVMALGAVMLGEYQLVGIMPYLAAVLFGLVIAEVLTAIGKSRSLAVAGAAAALTAMGLTWAAWIEAARDWGYVPTATWISIALGAVASAAWVRSSGRRGPSSLKPTSPPSGD